MAPSLSLKKGTRVVVDGLVKNQHLNGRHGRIVALEEEEENGLAVVDLDVLQTVRLAYTHLHKEVIPEQRQSRAPIFDGVIDSRPLTSDAATTKKPTVGIAAIRFLYRIRWVSHNLLNPDNKIELKNVPFLTVKKCSDLNAYAISHWNDIYRRLVIIAKTALPAEEQCFILPALASSHAIKSWDRGFQADCWLVGRDYEGSYYVPDSHRHVVYKVVGLVRNGTTAFKQRGEKLSLHKVPTKLCIAVFPWYGRLLYDSTVMPPQNELQRAEDPKLAHQLHNVVLASIKLGTVIDHLAELEH